MAKIDTTKPEDLVVELLKDNSEIVESFGREYASELLAFAESFSQSQARLKQFDRIENPADRVVHCLSFLFLMLDSLYTSTHLLVLGYLSPSGNLFRQAIEASCMAILLSSSKKVRIGSGAKAKERDFLEDFLKQKPYTRSHRAVSHVENNTQVLELDNGGVSRISDSKRFYSKYSHPNEFNFESRFTHGAEREWQVGNGYDLSKKLAYDHEFEVRVNFARQFVPSVIEYVYKRVHA